MDRLLKTVGVLVILDVITVYGYCLGTKGVYPPSHPWSGIALILLSVVLTVKLRGQVTSWVFLVATVLSAGLWTFAAVLYP